MDNSPDSGKKAGVMVKNGGNFSTELAFFTLVCCKAFTRRPAIWIYRSLTSRDTRKP